MSSTLFPVPSLSATEQDILLEIYHNPVVKKHLQMMALNDLIELGELSALGRSESELAIAHATVRGKLAILQTLLSIADQPLSSQTKE